MAFRLPRLPVNWKEQPQLFERYWDEAMSRIEETLNAILEIPELQDAIQAAQEAADNANTAADNAQEAADTAAGAAAATASETSIVNSFVANFVSPLISADDTGSVTIVDHDRVYGDTTLNPTVSVDGDVISTTAVAGEVVRVYYDQPSRAGGTVTYQYTIDPAASPVQGGDRHSVGVVTIPAPADPPNNGDYIKPPGFVNKEPI